MNVFFVTRKKMDMGFLHFHEGVHGCDDCTHSTRVKPTYAYNDMHKLRCTFGGFGTHDKSICDNHELASPEPQPDTRIQIGPTDI